jgi:putative phage-type endonuclease
LSAQLKPALSHDRGYIGGGNVAGILGLSPYKSPLDEFLVITGQADGITAERETFFERRKALEPWAAQVFAQRTGIKIVATNRRYTDGEHDFLKAEIDFETADGGNGETKTVHPLAARDWGDSESDNLPVYVTAQAMHGLMVTGRKHCWVHALIGFDDDRSYRIERDDETIAGIRAAELAFWNDNVLRMREPAPRTAEDLKPTSHCWRTTTICARSRPRPSRWRRKSKRLSCASSSRCRTPPR